MSRDGRNGMGREGDGRDGNGRGGDGRDGKGRGLDGCRLKKQLAGLS